MEQRRLAPINQTQKDLLIDFLEQNTDLQTGRFTKDFTFKKAQHLWDEVSSILNAVPGGAQKNWKQWRKTWQDLKKNTKHKLSNNKIYVCGTGGGPPPKSMNDSDSKILSMISNIVTDGDSEVKESFVEFDFDDTNYADKENADEFMENTVILNDTTKQTEPNYNQDMETMPQTSTTQIKGIKKIKGKMSKTRRLENSLMLSKDLLTVVEQKKNADTDYYKEKINYYKNINTYHEEKLKIFQGTLNVQEEMLQVLKDLRDIIE